MYGGMSRMIRGSIGGPCEQVVRNGAPYGKLVFCGHAELRCNLGRRTASRGRSKVR